MQSTTDFSSANLDSGVPYRAISHAWGSPNPERTITIDRCRFETTSSLYQALADVRLECDTRNVWNDGRCIKLQLYFLHFTNKGEITSFS